MPVDQIRPTVVNKVLSNTAPTAGLIWTLAASSLDAQASLVFVRETKTRPFTEVCGRLFQSLAIQRGVCEAGAPGGEAEMQTLGSHCRPTGPEPAS